VAVESSFLVLPRRLSHLGTPGEDKIANVPQREAIDVVVEREFSLGLKMTRRKAERTASPLVRGNQGQLNPFVS
jgi:hypothetical protein